VLNPPALKAHIGIHHLPFIGFKAVAGSTFPPAAAGPRLARSASFVPLPESTPINGPRSASRSCFDSISPLSFGRGLPVV
jgi:hypothetical protein